MNIGLILLILLTLAVAAVYPIWTYNKHWGRGPAIGRLGSNRRS